MFSGVFVIVGNLRQLGAETSWEALTGFTGQRRRVFAKFKLLHVYLEKCLKNVDVLPVSFYFPENCHFFRVPLHIGNITDILQSFLIKFSISWSCSALCVVY